MQTYDELIAHARKMREQELPNGVGNTIDALTDALATLQSDRERMREALDGIAKALPIGLGDSISTWRSLADACQTTAIKALTATDKPTSLD